MLQFMRSHKNIIYDLEFLQMHALKNLKMLLRVYWIIESAAVFYKSCYPQFQSHSVYWLGISWRTYRHPCIIQPARTSHKNIRVTIWDFPGPKRIVGTLWKGGSNRLLYQHPIPLSVSAWITIESCNCCMFVKMKGGEK